MHDFTPEPWSEVVHSIGNRVPFWKAGRETDGEALSRAIIRPLCLDIGQQLHINTVVDRDLHSNDLNV